MQLWYVCKENELSGPYTNNELQKAFEEQSIHPQSWLRKQEETEWIPASEHAFFVSKENAHAQHMDTKVQTWVILKWNGTQYVQRGPYHKTEVLSQVYRGETQYHDYIWTEGMTEWKAIGELEDFLPKQEEEKQPLKPEPKSETTVEENQLDLFTDFLKHPVNVNTFYQEEIPEEALPKEATQQKSVSNLHKIPKKPLPSYYQPMKDKKKKWWIFSFFCLFLSLCIAFWGESVLLVSL